MRFIFDLYEPIFLTVLYNSTFRKKKTFPLKKWHILLFQDKIKGKFSIIFNFKVSQGWHNFF